MAQRKLSFDFVKKSKGAAQELFIEGWANRTMMDGKKIIDRGKEHIPAEQWKIAEWLKNPVIFFNHDRSIPIGKGVDAKVTPEGLWIKAQISRSESPDIKKARDLIQEGILRTFSVGIDVEDEEYLDTGEIILKGVNLLETSVVSIPMNQESFFSISKKSLSETPLDILGYEIMKAKGKEFSALVHQKLHALAQNDSFDREATLERIVSESKLDKEYVEEVLSGQEKTVPENLVKVVAEVLELDEKELAAVAECTTEEEDPTKKEAPTVPLPEDDALDMNQGQPVTIALQQLTVLMGQLIAETQKTSKLLSDHFMAQAMKPGNEQNPPPPEEGEGMDEPLAEGEEVSDDEEELAEGSDQQNVAEEAKFLDTIAGYREKLEVTLSRFSV